MPVCSAASILLTSQNQNGLPWGRVFCLRPAGVFVSSDDCFFSQSWWWSHDLSSASEMPSCDPEPEVPRLRKSWGPFIPQMQVVQAHPTTRLWLEFLHPRPMEPGEVSAPSPTNFTIKCLCLLWTFKLCYLPTRTHRRRIPRSPPWGGQNPQCNGVLGQVSLSLLSSEVWN